MQISFALDWRMQMKFVSTVAYVPWNFGKEILAQPSPASGVVF
jgi:hypothetical protein